MEQVGEVVLHSNGSYYRIRRYYKGVHPGKGKIVNGITGLETMIEVDVIRPKTLANINDKP